MAKAHAVGIDATALSTGQPSGDILFVGIPEPTYAALSDVAAKHGMTIAQALARAVHDFCIKPVS